MSGGDLPRTDSPHHRDDTGAVLLPAHPSSVGAARQLVRDVLAQASRGDLQETAQLLVSELVTNALVHAGTPIQLDASADGGGLHVEVSDGSTQAPSPRNYAATAGTGRGIHLLEHLVDRWGTVTHLDGKTVWFDLASGDRLDETPSSPQPHTAGAGSAPGAAGRDGIDVMFLNVPLLLHAAWQEHAESLLREYLLATLDSDDPTQPLAVHAATSEAMSLLHEHIREPHLGEGAEELMAHAVEPGVSSQREVVRIPHTSVPHFRVLDEAMDAALVLADSGAFLTPPIQPEMRELRRWLCREVARQAGGEPATEWSSSPDVSHAVPLPPVSLSEEMADLEERAIIAANDANRIVVVSRQACDLLGYLEPGQLLGRRLVAIIPARYHQAHLAGFTLHLSNGRSPLLGRTVVVPMLRSDGTEIAVELLVESHQEPGGRHVFVARMQPA